ncbi:hypothetical protein DPM19_18180 [Actinomadura craniellae]|uniref:DUF3987 domain-containing protein n=1 Tax=Actinomadura craniellae TaxID=2231787 RepID=A0A365H3C7_9ACTN|nr:YfjI family protein [Actinomadura craniellae]RAY13607.1 hypothetical protein DPM19_18180 [Actinomadura craniellae]
MTDDLVFDQEAAALYCDTMWQRREGFAALAFGRDGRWNAAGKYEFPRGNWTEAAYRWPDERNLLLKDVAAELAVGSVDVYVCPLLRQTDKRARGNAAHRTVVWADADGIDGPAVVNLGALIVGSGGPGHAHVYVQLDREVPEDVREALARGLMARSGNADPKVADNDVLRLPGTLNHKTSPPSPVPWMIPPGHDLARVWAPDDLTQALGIAPPLPAAAPTSAPTMTAPTALPLPSPDVEQALGRDTGNRSDDFAAAVWACYRAGWTREQTIGILRARHHPGAVKYGARLAAEVDRVWLKANDEERRLQLWPPTAVQPTPPPPAVPAVPDGVPTPAVPPAATVRHALAHAPHADIIRGVFPDRAALAALPWPAPGDDDQDHEQGPLPDFPVDALPGDLGKYVAALAEYNQISADIAALVVLGTLAVIAGGYATVTGQWTEKTLNLYVAPMAESGEGKSPLVSAIAAPVLALERELRAEYDAEFGEKRDRYEIAQKTRDRLIAKIADAPTKERRDELTADLEVTNKEIEENRPPPRPQLLAGDATPESLGRIMTGTCSHIGMIADEGGFLGTLAGRYTKGNVANIDLVLLAFDAAMPYRVDRIGRESFEIERPSLSMALCVQPAIMREAIASPALVDRGFINRFLVALPESRAGRRDKRPPKVPGHLSHAWRECVRTVFYALLPDGTAWDKEEQEPKPPEPMTVGEAAEDLHYEWRVILERRVDPDDGDLAIIKGWTKKLEGAAYRIAALLHLAAGADPEQPIGAHTMADAIRIGEWAIPHALAVLGAADGDQDGDQGDAAGERKNVLDWIRRKGRAEFTIRDVYQGLKGRKWVRSGGAEAVRDVLVDLTRRGYLATVARTSGDGRPLPDALFVAHPDAVNGPR